MKSYLGRNQLRLVGKAWEIRCYLRKLAADQRRMKLGVWLDRRHPCTAGERTKLNASSAAQLIEMKKNGSSLKLRPIVHTSIG